MMSLWDALRMNMMISYQELVRTFLSFADLDKMAKADPSWWQSVKKFASRETTYTPGTERDARAQNLQGLRETYGGQSQSGPSFSEGMRDTNANIR
ncbi:hypothetical protein QU719_18035 [Klebsiella pneumoniae]|nr:hypothetical protein QU719_18035 [Klebsiella pneumoniae]